MRRFALLLCALTVGLITLGGLVHNTHSSLACPDWPLCFGHVMPKMEGGVLVEHSHRLVASSIGFLTLVLAALLWRKSAREGDSRWRAYGLLALGLVIAQGVLGGLTVIYRLPPAISTMHLGTSMLYLACMLFIAYRLRARDAHTSAVPALRKWSLVAIFAVYAQLVIGALMRHEGAGLACVDWPLCRGTVWPRHEHWLVQLHALHRLWACGVFLLTLYLAVATWRGTTRALPRALAIAGPLLVIGQITLGILSVTTYLDVAPVTLHLLGAALIWATYVALACEARGVAHDVSTTQARQPQRHAWLNVPHEAVAGGAEPSAGSVSQ